MTFQFQATTPRRFPDGSITNIADCLICHLDDADESAVVFRDETWACEVTPGFEVPGWFVLRARRHALGWQELNSHELETFGQHAKDVVESVTAVFESPATYVLNFAESYPHFHCLVAARGDDVPLERRVSRILDLRNDRLDRAESLKSVGAVRARYEAALAQRAPSAPTQPAG